MRHNGRPPVLMSELKVWQVDLRRPAAPMLLCPFCARLVGLCRGQGGPLVWDHKREDDSGRCRGTGQRVRVDLDPVTWWQAYQRASRDRDVVARRAPQVKHRLPTLSPQPLPIHEIARMQAACG